MTTDVFEMQLIAAMLASVDVYKKTVGMVDVTMFTSELSMEAYELIVKFFAEYKRIPAKDELIHWYKSGHNVSGDTAFDGYITTITSATVDPIFVINELCKYVRLRKLEHLFKNSYDDIKLNSTVDVSDVVSKMFRIQMASMNDKHIYGVGIHEAEFLLAQDEDKTHVPTNIPKLNELLTGGLSGGQLGIILAPPNYGKTMTLLNFALYDFIKGYNVLFVTLEMREFSILRRSMMLLSGALKTEVTMDTIKLIKEHKNNQFIILYRPVKTITVDYLYSVIHQADADGIKFDLVYIDYADLLVSHTRYKEKRFELSDIFDSLKSFAQVLNMPVWSATQANRAGLRAETVTMEHMAEDISKAFISDVILSLNDKVQANSNLKLFLTKHREGKSDIYIDIFVNEKMWFEDVMNVTADFSQL